MSVTDHVTERKRLAENEHVCAFCQAVFDVSETTDCPLCDAEVVVRGAR